MSYRSLTSSDMESTKLSAKGQVVLPKGVRDAHGWGPGVEFTVESTPGGVVLRAKAGKRSGRIAELAGMLKRSGRRPVSLKAMDAAIAAEVRARRARDRY
jgi:AbrB family looped-hinge helix DNA binding protein